MKERKPVYESPKATRLDETESMYGQTTNCNNNGSSASSCVNNGISAFAACANTGIGVGAGCANPGNAPVN